MTQVENRPGYSGREATRFVAFLKSQSSLHTETPGDVKMVHEFILLHRKVAVYRQRPIYFINKDILSVCNRCK